MKALLASIACVTATPATSLSAQAAPEPIRDNSFLVEEAYNQDRSVAQHIATFTDYRDALWALTFTDEWPLGGVQDQLSVGFTLLGDQPDQDGEAASFAVNYRRQVLGSVECAYIVSPRISLFGAAGSSGTAPFALQLNLPASVTLGRSLVSHWNLGGTVGAVPATLNAGASLVWLALPWMNVLFEGVYQGAAGQAPAFTVNPGVRWAFNVGATQIVPGVALPLAVGDTGADGVFLYLSVEHPFGPTE